MYAKQGMLREAVTFPYPSRELQMCFDHNTQQGTDVYANGDIYRQKFVSVVLVCWRSGEPGKGTKRF